MEVDRESIVEALRIRGDVTAASRAEAELPDRVDTDRELSVFVHYDLNPGFVVAMVSP